MVIIGIIGAIQWKWWKWCHLLRYIEWHHLPFIHHLFTLKIDKEILHSRAFELLQKDIPTYAKVTLIQIYGMNRVKTDQVRPILRDILKKSKETQLKVSAIAALGEYGNHNDLAVIEPYCKSSDVRLRTATITAYKKINSN